MSESLKGRTIDGKFQVQELLGAGGLGSVYQAQDSSLSRAVAIKILHVRTMTDPENRLRFEREARILSSLSHPHIVGIFNFGTLPDGYPYMAMELLEGETLSRRLAKKNHLDWRTTAKAGIQICQALAYAHKAGVVHRDLKPQNIMLLSTPDPDYVKVLDFGQSKLLPSDDKEVQKLTQTGAVIGSFNYMSPELCAGLDADPRSDVYSLGCTLYECLTGNPPFESDNPLVILNSHRSELPELISKRKDLTGIPKAMEYVIFKSLQKSPGDRYQTMEEFESALSMVLEGNTAGLTQTSIVMVTPRKNETRTVTLATFIVVSIALGVAGLVYLKLAQEQNSQPNAPAGNAKIHPQVQTRLDNISRAKRFAVESQAWLGAKNDRQSLKSLRKALDIISLPCPVEGRNDAICAAGDIEVLELLAVSARYIKTEPSDDAGKRLWQVSRNNMTIAPELRARLELASARIRRAFGDNKDAVESFWSSLEIYVQLRNLKKCKEIYAEAQETMKAAEPGDRKYAELQLTVAKMQILLLEGKEDEMPVLDQRSKILLEELYGTNRKPYWNYLCYLYDLESARHDAVALKDTLEKMEYSLLTPIHRFTESKVVTDATGSFPPQRLYEMNLSRADDLIRRSPTPELKKRAQELKEKLERKRETFLKECQSILSQ